MDDLRKKYNLARRAKNQANYRTRKEREWAERSWQNSQTWMKTAADAKAQALTAEREARAAREAVVLKDRAIHTQLQRINELERQNGLLRDQLRTALYRDVPPLMAPHPGGSFHLARKSVHDIAVPVVFPAFECARHAREATERAMARIEPHARPWWQRLVWWPKSDGGR